MTDTMQREDGVHEPDPTYESSKKIAETERACDAEWVAFVATGGPVPDFMKFMYCVDVNVRHIQQLTGAGRNDPLKRVMKAVKALHVNERHWRIGWRSEKHMKKRLEAFFIRAPHLLQSQRGRTGLQLATQKQRKRLARKTIRLKTWPTNFEPVLRLVLIRHAESEENVRFEA